MDADMVMDVRFLPNPHWVDELRPQTGRDPPSASMCWANPARPTFSRPTIGCSASSSRGYSRGQALHDPRDRMYRRKHRSVAIAEALVKAGKRHQSSVRALHRDLGRE